MDNNELDLNKIVFLLWKKKYQIVRYTAIVTLLSAVISLILPERFTSTTTIIPSNSSNSLGTLADLAGLAGFNVFTEGPDMTILYPDILLSEAVLTTVIYNKYFYKTTNDSVDLIYIYGLSGENENKAFEKTLDKLRKKLQVTQDKKTLIVTLTLEEKDPELTANILNLIVEQLDFFLRRKKNTSASEQRKFIEHRLGEVEKELKVSEDELKEFREKNRLVVSPELLLRQERLLRNVSINNAIYLELKKQFEIAKIEEVKNIPAITVLDKARPAAIKSFPKRTIIVVVSFILGFFGTCLIFVFEDKLRSYYRGIYRLFQKS